MKIFSIAMFVILTMVLCGCHNGFDSQKYSEALRLEREGTSVYMSNNFQDASIILHRALQMNQFPHYFLCFKLAQCHFFLGQIDQALILYEKTFSVHIKDLGNQSIGTGIFSFYHYALVTDSQTERAKQLLQEYEKIKFRSRYPKFVFYDIMYLRILETNALHNEALSFIERSFPDTLREYSLVNGYMDYLQGNYTKSVKEIELCLPAMKPSSIEMPRKFNFSVYTSLQLLLFSIYNLNGQDQKAQEMHDQICEYQSVSSFEDLFLHEEVRIAILGKETWNLILEQEKKYRK